MRFQNDEPIVSAREYAVLAVMVSIFVPSLKPAPRERVRTSMMERSTGFADPASCLGVTHQIQQPVEHANSVTTPKTEVSRWPGQGVANRAWVVVPAAECVRHHLGDSLRILAIGEEVGGDPRRAGDEEPTESGPLAASQKSAVKADIFAARCFRDLSGAGPSPRTMELYRMILGRLVQARSAASGP